MGRAPLPLVGLPERLEGKAHEYSAGFLLEKNTQLTPIHVTLP